MKSTTLAFTAISLLQLAVAQPSRRRHAHNAHQVVKKGADVVVTVTNVVYAEATDAPQVIVFVDAAGKPVSTTTEGLAASVQTTAPVVAAPVVQAAAPVVDTPAAVVQAAAPATYSAAPASTSPASSSPSTGNGFGLVYSPYNGDGTCKTLDQVQTDFKSISKDYTLIRTYGTDCNQVANVLSVVKDRKIKLFAGMFNLAGLESQVATIVSAAKGDWTNFDTISVGNELVNSGSASAGQVVAAISTVRGLLKSAGYTGNVVTVDTLVAARNFPELCDASDFCAVNCHPFFDGNVAAADSGSFLTAQIPTLAAKLANKNQKIVITETGWPWQGNSNGKAVPSMSNQASAISSIKGAFTSNPESVILFTAFNDIWKKNSAAQFEAEQYWGMGGQNPPSG